MSNISADKVIGLYLVAKKNVTKYGPDKVTPVGVFRPGETVGRVYSYITSPYIGWMFFDAAGNAYYTKHMSSVYEKPQAVINAEVQVQAQQQQQAIENEGKFWYYTKKVGIPLLLTASVLFALNSYLKYKK